MGFTTGIIPYTTVGAVEKFYGKLLPPCLLLACSFCRASGLTDGRKYWTWKGDIKDKMEPFYLSLFPSFPLLPPVTFPLFSPCHPPSPPSSRRLPTSKTQVIYRRSWRSLPQSCTHTWFRIWRSWRGDPAGAREAVILAAALSQQDTSADQCQHAWTPRVTGTLKLNFNK